MIEAALGDDDYLVDDAFSVADIVVGSVLGFARTGELTELPAGVVPTSTGSRHGRRGSGPSPSPCPPEPR